MGLDIVELMMAIEEHFDISISDEEFEALHTARELIEFIVARKGGGEWTHERVRTEVRKLLIEKTSIPENFDENARFIQDLGID